MVLLHYTNTMPKIVKTMNIFAGFNRKMNNRENIERMKKRKRRVCISSSEEEPESPKKIKKDDADEDEKENEEVIDEKDKQFEAMDSNRGGKVIWELSQDGCGE